MVFALWNFFIPPKKPQRILALELGHDWIKCLDLAFSRVDPAVFSIVQQAGFAWSIDQKTQSMDALKRFLEKNHEGAKNVVLSIPDAVILRKNISVSSRLTAREREEAATLAAANVMQDQPSSVYVDYYPLESSPQAETVTLHLLMIRAALVQSIHAVLQPYGFNLRCVEPRSQALMRALSESSDLTEATSLLLNVNRGDWAVLIVERPQLLFYQEARDAPDDGTDTLEHLLQCALQWLQDQSNVRLQHALLVGEHPQGSALILKLQQTTGLVMQAVMAPAWADGEQASSWISTYGLARGGLKFL